jgi:hypothetical protein
VSGSSARLKFTPTYAHNTVKLTRKGTELWQSVQLTLP